MPLPRETGRVVSTGGSALALVVVAWLLYLAVKVAQHVGAWPF